MSNLMPLSSAAGISSIVVDVIGEIDRESGLFIIAHVLMSDGKKIPLDEYRGLCVVDLDLAK